MIFSEYSDILEHSICKKTKTYDKMSAAWFTGLLLLITRSYTRRYTSSFHQSALSNVRLIFSVLLVLSLFHFSSEKCDIFHRWSLFNENNTCFYYIFSSQSFPVSHPLFGTPPIIIQKQPGCLSHNTSFLYPNVHLRDVCVELWSQIRTQLSFINFTAKWQ